jgi:hypothetical protein
MASNADYASQFSLRVSGWRKSPSAWLSFWPLGYTMNSQSDVIQVLTDYYTAFSTLDVQLFLPYFHEPSLLVGHRGIIAAPTHGVLVTAFAPTLKGLRERGFGRSELSVRLSKMLSATAALVTGVAIRYKADGQELERVGTTYVLHQHDAGWKIAVAVLHDADENRAA